MSESSAGLVFFAAAIGCITWTVIHLLGVWTILRSPRLGHTEPDDRDDWPLVSIVFAAKDEEVDIEASLNTMMALDYPALEIIAVNDRSEDSTGVIINRMAAEDSRIKAVHITELPEGWLGKVNALKEGVDASKGQWVIFTDADVRLQQDMIKRTVTFASEKSIDHLVIFPHLTGSSFTFDVAFVAFSILFLVGTRAYTIGKSWSKAYIGVGAFNMVRREVFDRSEGFEWLRMEVGDDVGLGLAMKNAGARNAFALASLGVSLTWYSTLGGMFNGMAKNLFSVARYSYPRLMLTIITLSVLALSPFAWILPEAPLSLKVLSGIAFTSSFILGLTSKNIFMRRVMPYLLGPLGFILIMFMFINSAFLCARNGGIVWRGTLYPVDELRKNQRIKF